MKNWKYICGAEVGNSVTEKEFNSEADLRRWCIDHNYTYTPVGGGYYRLEDDKPGSHKPDIEAHVKSGNSKVGNAKWSILEVTNPNTPNDGKYVGTIEADTKYEAESKFKKENPNIENRVVAVKVKNASVEEQNEKLFHSLEKDVEKKEEKNDEEIEEVGNFKTGKSALKPGDRVQSYGVQGTVRKVEGENSDNIYGEPIIEVEWDNGTIKKVGEHYLRKIGNKVGNAGYPMLKSKVEELSKEGKSYEEVVKELLKFGFTRADIAQYEGYIREHIGNKKVGNSAYDEGVAKGKADKRAGKLITAAGFDMHVPGFSKYSFQEKEEFKKGYYSSNDLTKDDIYKSWKTGNSASDDKFAYVMREFDEGKLKTPDGKVVTDPAQAKAIAYSESKKTENGCARARNAIKK